MSLAPESASSSSISYTSLNPLCIGISYTLFNTLVSLRTLTFLTVPEYLALPILAVVVT